jgi:hypothetical protein
LSPIRSNSMRASLFVLAIVAASPLAAQTRVPGIVPGQQPVHLTTSARTLTITSYEQRLATPPMELEKINCHLQSSSNNAWVVTCGDEDLPSKKPRTFIFDANHHDSSACEITVRYDTGVSKWKVDIVPLKAARCANRWVDDDHLELRP